MFIKLYKKWEIDDYEMNNNQYNQIILFRDKIYV